MIKKIGKSYETSSKGMDSRTNIIIKIFKNIYKTMEDTPNIKYKIMLKVKLINLLKFVRKNKKYKKIKLTDIQ